MRRLLVTSVLLLLVAAGCDPAPPTEEEQPQLARPVTRAAPVPEPRTEVGAARAGDRIVVVGGLRADGSATGRVDVYHLERRSWSEGPPLPRPLHHAGVATFDGRVHVAGGYVGDGATWVETAEVWSIDPAGTDGWRREPDLRTARGAPGLAATADHLVAFGGTSGGQVLATAEVLTAREGAWTTAPSLRQPREHTAATTVGGRVYAIAGRVGGLETNLRSVESIEPGAFAAAWRVEPDLSVARGGIAAATVDGRPCVAGGEAPGGTIGSVECLVGGRWRPMGLFAEPRHGLGVVPGDDGRLHLLAGGPEPGLFVSDAHEVLTLAADP